MAPGEVADSLLLVHGERIGVFTMQAATALTLQVLDTDGTVVLDLTDTANGSPWQPVWSNDGRWVAFAYLGDAGEWRLGVSDLSGTTFHTRPIAGRPDYQTFNFDDSRVFALVGGTGRFGLVSIDPFSDAEPVTITTGSPLFFDESPTGALTFHDADGVYVIDPVTMARSDLLAEIPVGTFSTPRWANAPDASYAIVDTGDTLALALVLTNGDGTLPLQPITGPASIDSLVDTGVIALVVNSATEPTGDDVLGPGLHVIELDADDPQRRTLDELALGAPVLAPSGDAVLALRVGPDGRQSVLHQLDGSGSIATPPYEPPEAPLAVMNDQFYDQFVASATPFAPDSSAFAFTGTLAGQTGVHVQPADGSEPFYVGRGAVVWWSPT